MLFGSVANSAATAFLPTETVLRTAKFSRVKQQHPPAEQNIQVSSSSQMYILIERVPPYHVKFFCICGNALRIGVRLY